MNEGWIPEGKTASNLLSISTSHLQGTLPGSALLPRGSLLVPCCFSGVSMSVFNMVDGIIFMQHQLDHTSQHLSVESLGGFSWYLIKNAKPLPRLTGFYAMNDCTFQQDLPPLCLQVSSCSTSLRFLELLSELVSQTHCSLHPESPFIPPWMTPTVRFQQSHLFSLLLGPFIFLQSPYCEF